MSGQGFIDFYGFHLAGAGWFFCGWMPIYFPKAARLELKGLRVACTFEGGNAISPGLITFFERDDLKGEGLGFVVFLENASRFQGRFNHLDIYVDNTSYHMEAVENCMKLRDVDLINRLKGVLVGIVAGMGNEVLAIVARRGFNGIDTINNLAEPVRIGIDEVILCRPDGVVIIGWCLAPPGVIVKINVCAGTSIAVLDLAASVRVDRMDVLEAVGISLGLTDRACGFITFLPIAVTMAEQMYMQVETRDREIGYLTLQARGLQGMVAIRRIVDILDVRYSDVCPAFDNTIGPALLRLNAERLIKRPTVSQLHFGITVGNPRCSIIVPLYGRIDYLEYQLAFFSNFYQTRDLEIIYVLDDPPRRHETEILAESVFARFRIPFTLILLGENVGFSPANNIGLAHARSDYICFLNSDAFPQSGNWIDHMCRDLEEHPDIGAVGGLLLFEDNSVQHEGMVFEPIQAFGNLKFPLHRGKGRRPRPGLHLERVDFITGACMVMRRSLATHLGGFDEGYMIGDFEDCDLCARIHAQGKTCAVNHDVRLYHLERRSQASPDHRWRVNVTLFNAWLYSSRWTCPPSHAEHVSLSSYPQ